MNSRIDKMGTRERLIVAMTDLLRRKGFHGFGLNDVLAEAKAPKGVLYHHFPGGKVELAVVSIQTAVNRVISGFEKMKNAQQGAVQVLRTWLDHAQKTLELSGFDQGCPLAAVALESTSQDQALRQVLKDGFAAIRKEIAAMLIQSGMNPDKAGRFSTLIVAAYEGALLQARIDGTAGPANETINLLLELIRMELAPAQG